MSFAGGGAEPPPKMNPPSGYLAIDYWLGCLWGSSLLTPNLYAVSRQRPTSRHGCQANMQHMQQFPDFPNTMTGLLHLTVAGMSEAPGKACQSLIQAGATHAPYQQVFFFFYISAGRDKSPRRLLGLSVHTSTDEHRHRHPPSLWAHKAWAHTAQQHGQTARTSEGPQTGAGTRTHATT